MTPLFEIQAEWTQFSFAVLLVHLLASACYDGRKGSPEVSITFRQNLSNFVLSREDAFGRGNPCNPSNLGAKSVNLKSYWTATSLILFATKPRVTPQNRTVSFLLRKRGPTWLHSARINRSVIIGKVLTERPLLYVLVNPYKRPGCASEWRNIAVTEAAKIRRMDIRALLLINSRDPR